MVQQITNGQGTEQREERKKHLQDPHKLPIFTVKYDHGRINS